MQEAGKQFQDAKVRKTNGWHWKRFHLHHGAGDFALKALPYKRRVVAFIMHITLRLSMIAWSFA
jgi:hypothetical protein